MSNTMKRDEIGPFMQALRDEFARQLAQLGPRALKKKTREDLEAGFADGSRSMFNALEHAGYLIVDRGAAPGAVTPVDPTAFPLDGREVTVCCRPAPAEDAPMRIVDHTGDEVAPGVEVVDFRGGKAKLVGPARRNRPGGDGKVFVEIDGRERTFNAAVYGLEVR